MCEIQSGASQIIADLRPEGFEVRLKSCVWHVAEHVSQASTKVCEAQSLAQLRSLQS